jgi:lysophospholipase L1-like esterase
MASWSAKKTLELKIKSLYDSLCMKATLPAVKKPVIIAAILAVAALAYTFLYPDAAHKVLSETANQLARTVKVMPLGDSITEGNTQELQNGYRLDLLGDLKDYKVDFVGSYKHGLPNLADHDTQAQSGACIRTFPGCSSSLFEQTPQWVKTYQPDIVIMQGGVNDFCCGRQTEDPHIVRNTLRDWVNEVWAAKPDTYIVVIGMPTGFTTGIPYKNWIPLYVAAERLLGKQIAYVPLDGTEGLSDRIHPDVFGYKQLADRLAAVLQPVIGDLVNQ